jgi:hypothetical protein
LIFFINLRPQWSIPSAPPIDLKPYERLGHFSLYSSYHIATSTPH